MYMRRLKKTKKRTGRELEGRWERRKRMEGRGSNRKGRGKGGGMREEKIKGKN